MFLSVSSFWSHILSIPQTTAESLPSNITMFFFGYHMYFKVLTWSCNVVFPIILAYIFPFIFLTYSKGFFALNWHPPLSISFLETAHNKWQTPEGFVCVCIKMFLSPLFLKIFSPRRILVVFCQNLTAPSTSFAFHGFDWEISFNSLIMMHLRTDISE